MTAIWQHSEGRWRLLRPSGFPSEDELHTLVEQSPQLLPLSGSPRIVVLGREVPLGSGSADLVGIEPSGRLAIVEIKLARNSEARRAIVAQILAYAAYLHGHDAASIERHVLGRHLEAAGHDSLLGAVLAELGEGEISASEFIEGVSQSLASGEFRLVLVLDEAPPELVRLVGYLAAMTEKLVIDLVTVASYAVGDSQIIVPQRVEPARVEADGSAPPRPRPAKGTTTPGTETFVAFCDSLPAERVADLRAITVWAEALEREGITRLVSRDGSGRSLLRLELLNESATVATVWAEPTHSGLGIHPTVLTRAAPQAAQRVMALARASGAAASAPYLRLPLPEELLEAVADAYREAADLRR